MSHSFKKLPIVGNCGGSDKLSKRFANRNLRREAKEAVARAITTDNLDGFVTPILREASSTWGFVKDGRHLVTNPECIAKALRK